MAVCLAQSLDSKQEGRDELTHSLTRTFAVTHSLIHDTIALQDKYDATAGGVEQGPANAENRLAVALPVSLPTEVHSDPAPAAHRPTHDVHHPVHHHSTADQLGVRKAQGAIVHGSHPTHGQHI